MALCAPLSSVFLVFLSLRQNATSSLAAGYQPTDTQFKLNLLLPQLRFVSEKSMNKIQT